MSITPHSTHPLVRSFAGAVLALICASSLACSFSHSSDSSSDSSKNSSDSSSSPSDSSSPGNDNNQNQNDKNQAARFDTDVEQYTVSFLAAGGSDNASFLSGLGEIARHHGVSDWESDPTVWEAVGRGLARSPASTAQRVAYQTAWTGGDAARQSAVAKGLATTQ